MKERLARSCARGWRQLSLVNELLPGKPVRYKYVSPPTYSHTGRQVKRFGSVGLPHSSFFNLRQRLVEVGFVIVDNPLNCTIMLRFPEEDTK